MSGVSPTDDVTDLPSNASDDDYYYYYEPYSYLGDPTYVYPISAALAVGVVGTLANGFVLLVLLRFSNLRPRPSTILVLHQTVTDLLSSLLVLLTYACLVTLDGKLRDRWGDFVCKMILSETFFWTAFVASSFSLVSITVERYLMVVHPVFHRNRFTNRLVAILIVIDWVLAAIFLIPNTLVSGVEELWCVYHFWPSPAHKVAYGYIYFFGTFFLPVLILVYGYGTMIHILLKKGRVIQSSDVSGQKKCKLSKGQINITMTMVAVAVVYVLCLMPYQVYYLCLVAIPLPDENVPYYTLLIISLVNCCINPFIYAVKFEAFKVGVRRMFGLKTELQDASVTGSMAVD